MGCFYVIDPVALFAVRGEDGIVYFLGISAGNNGIIGVLRPVGCVESGLGIDIDPDLIAKGAFYEVLTLDLNGNSAVLVFFILV